MLFVSEMRIWIVIAMMFALLGLDARQRVPASISTVRPIVGEMILLSGTSERALMWSHNAINSVYSFDTSGNKTTYVEGVDYIVTARGLVRTPGSSIFDFSTYTIPVLNANGTFPSVNIPRNPPDLLTAEVYVDYVAHITDPTIPALASISMTGKNVLLAGDSIAGGALTTTSLPSGFNNGFFRLLKGYLSSINFTNLSASGQSLSYFTSRLPDLISSNAADVYIIEFGMNDHSAGVANVSAFQTELQSDVNQIVTAGKKAILVGFPRENPKWENYDEPATIAYNAAIKTVADGAGVPFVDMRLLFDKARDFKSVQEMFADNYHHPSDYGHRIYFSAILPYLINSPIQASAVPEYVTLP